MKVKLIIISIILLLVMVFASGCIPFMEKLGLVNPTDEEQLSPEKGGPPDGLVKVLIGFKEKPGAAQQAMVKGVGGKIKYTYNIIPAIAASIPEKAIEALKKNPNVTDVELDSMVYALDTELDNSWGVDRIDAEVVHFSGNKGAGVKVAIIDTGIDRNHEDLPVVTGKSFVNYTDDFDDDDGHGTHVAGIVAALDNNIGVVGVAPEASLYALKALNSEGVGYVSDVVYAIQWSTVNGIDVINMSLGGRKNIFLEWACNLAYYSDGLLLVAAAGNGGAVIYPAAYSSVIAVSATDEYDNLASFSSTGKQVELAAPGVDINSTLPGDAYSGETWSGTSMASPHVAGTAALVWAANPGWSNDTVRTQLQSTAEDIGLSTSEQGYGLVDAAEAVGITSADNLGPVTSDVVADPNPTNGATSVTLTADVNDATTGNSNIAGAEYFVDTVGADGTGIHMGTSEGAFDSSTEGVKASIIVSGWTVGPHTLYVHGMDTAGNWGATESVVLNVTEESSNIMYVESIIFSSKVAGPNKFLYTTVKVVDGNEQPLGGVRVEMTLTNGGGSRYFVGDTGSNGTVKFTLNKAPSGSYTAEVTKLILTGYFWDITNENNVISDSCTLQDDGTVNQ